MLATRISAASLSATIAVASTFGTASGASGTATTVVALILAAAHDTCTVASDGPTNDESWVHQRDSQPGMCSPLETQRLQCESNAWGVGGGGTGHRRSCDPARRGSSQLQEACEQAYGERACLRGFAAAQRACLT